MEKDHILEVNNLTVSFPKMKGKVKAVDNVSFNLRKGEILGIVGESGSGKTVTALSILNLLSNSPGKIEHGEVLFNSDTEHFVDLLNLDERKLSKVRGNEIAMIFQEPLSNLNPNHKCGLQVDETLINHNCKNKLEAKLYTKELFEKVGLYESERIYDSYPHQLSGGQLQRVMIAMAISCKPKLLIADEPTTSLDVTIQANILNLLKSLQKELDMSTIFISHDLGVINEIADKVIVLRKGVLVEAGMVNSIYKNPNHPYTKGLIACRPPLDVRLKRLPVLSDFDSYPGVRKDKIPAITKQEFLDHLQVLTTNEPILEVSALNKKYVSSIKSKDHVQAIRNFSLEVRQGEVHGLVGESGCGKSTLASCVALLENWDSGKILYRGTDIKTYNNASIREYRKNVQIIFQDPYSSLNPRMIAGDAIIEPMVVHKLHKNYRNRKNKAITLMETVGLTPDHFDRYPHEFSGGERQRICIARALSLEPKFLICDEPVSALDVSVQAQVLNLLTSLKEDFGLSMLFISHDLSVIKHMSDFVSVMQSGGIVEKGNAEYIFNSPTMDYTKSLISAIPSYSLSI